MSALAAFHAALFGRLNADPGLAAYQHASMQAPGVGVYDHVPKKARYPYVVLGVPTGAQIGVQGADASANTRQLDVWDDYQGTERVAEVMGLLTEALREPLTVAGNGTARARMDFETILPDPSGLRHGVYRVRRAGVA